MSLADAGHSRFGGESGKRNIGAPELELSLDVAEPELAPRKLAVRFTDTQRYPLAGRRCLQR